MSDVPATVPWPPIVFAGGIVASVALAWLVPLPWIPPPISEVLFAVGLLVMAGSLFLVVQAIRTLRKSGTTVLPTRAADALVTTGPYRLSRNPIYLGDAALMIGAGLAFGIAWFIIFAILCAFATQKLAIENEERHLSIRFGKRYRDYAKRVRRWI
jgi:protein-S-isoprenylcysteine O-methyltransferase Ste14